MTDRYAQLVNTPIGKLITKQIGLPQPPRLERHDPSAPTQPVITGPVLLGAADGAGEAGSSRLAAPVAKVLKAIDADVSTSMDEGQRFKALVFDATGIESSEELDRAWAFFAPAIGRVLPCGRVIILGTSPEDCPSPPAAIAQRALEGLARAIGKEVKQGATSQLVYVRPKGEGQLESTLRFLLSPR
ncbi:MAG: 3-oxoacyl-ACP reductase, partial [Solirubrobacteraceae bacterium]